MKTGTQRTCLKAECRATLRSRSRSERYHKQRPTLLCEWCEEPILEPRKRRYHDDCRADKNRLRVRHYNETHKTRSGPKTARSFSGSISCIICRSVVPRTGARQVICKAPECVAARKNARKREAKARRRQLTQLRVLKHERLAQQKPPRNPTPFEPVFHRVVI